VIHAQEPGFPGFYRLVWQDHVREFSQLTPADRSSCVEALATIEQAMLRHLRPAKVNLAALGNAVPHLHWHVIARFEADSHFPGAVWAGALRQPDPVLLRDLEQRLPDFEQDLLALLPRCT
jgi:diadenosine tetraphosphate (Ap4A) HIT family hydrolase